MKYSPEGPVTFAIVEDEQIESEAMEQFIKQFFPRDTVLWKREDGESALQQLRDCQPDILIVDIEMPVLNGLELCEILFRQHYEGVILINTAYTKFSYAKKAISLQVFDYLIKPVDNEELYDTLRCCVQEAERRKREKRERKSMEGMVQEAGQYALAFMAAADLNESPNPPAMLGRIE